MPSKRYGPKRSTRTINLTHICGHVTHGVVADCMNTAELTRRAKQPCPDCQAAGNHALQEHTASSSALGGVIHELKKHERLNDPRNTQEGNHDNKHEHPATD